MLSIREAVEQAVSNWDRWSQPVHFADGSSIRFKMVQDENSSLDNDGDWFGSIHYGNRGDNQRPKECDGAAEKIVNRHGDPLWWQPPEAAKHDAEVKNRLRERVQGYFYDHWTYCGLVCERLAPLCECCGERKSHTESLWGIESDAGEYFTEVANNLVYEMFGGNIPNIVAEGIDS